MGSIRTSKKWKCRIMNIYGGRSPPRFLENTAHYLIHGVLEFCIQHSTYIRKVCVETRLYFFLPESDVDFTRLVRYLISAPARGAAIPQTNQMPPGTVANVFHTPLGHWWLA